MEANIATIDKSFRDIRLALKKEVPAEYMGENGIDWLKVDVRTVLMVYASMQAMLARERIDPRHSDGGASQWHGGLSLAGKRSVRVFLEPAADTASSGAAPILELVLRQNPGDFYLGALC